MDKVSLVWGLSLIHIWYIDIYNVTAFQEFPSAGNAVAHYIVDAGAHTFGEAFVHEGGGDGVVVCGEAIHLSLIHIWEVPGKQTLENGEVVLGVVKNGKLEKPDYQVDGISGGTITSVGVDAMLKACLSSYKNFLTNNNEEE